MTQTIVTILIVAGCAGWLGWMGWRFLRPRAGGKGCGAGCCDGVEPKPAGAGGERVMMISSDDLRARVKARK